MDLTLGMGRSTGGGHDNPPQDSCLENTMGRGAWWATDRGFAESWKWLKWLGTHIHRCFLGNIILQITIKFWSIYLQFMSCVNKHTPPPPILQRHFFLKIYITKLLSLLLSASAPFITSETSKLGGKIILNFLFASLSFKTFCRLIPSHWG